MRKAFVLWTFGGKKYNSLLIDTFPHEVLNPLRLLKSLIFLSASMCLLYARWYALCMCIFMTTVAPAT